VTGDRVLPSEPGAAAATPRTAGVVAFVSRGLPELRTVLRGIRDTTPAEAQFAVVASGPADYDATYLLRQHLRGRLYALQFEEPGARRGHCGLDRAHQLVDGDYIARVDDTLEFQPGWLERAIEALEADPSLGCLSLVPPSDYHRGRGRPRTVNIEPVEVDRLDMRCYVVSRELVVRHECELMARQPGCRFQESLRADGRRLAFLPGLASPLGVVEVPSEFDGGSLEPGLPPHEGATGAMQRLEQEYDLGDDVLLTCLSCGAPELEVLAARIRFCERHGVGIGFWYELRCPECGELHYKDDYQFRCPE
jgi:hypothetical protein